MSSSNLCKMKVQILLLASLVHAVVGQVEFCDMCGGNGSPANSALVIPFLAIGENQNPTCQQVFDFANTAVTPSDDVCSLIQSHKDFCGCPNASPTPLDNCSLCPGGALPVNLNAQTPFEDTCNELDTYLRYLPADLCMTERVSSIMRTDAFCGCPGVTAECSMCTDGSNVLANPDLKVPFYEFLGSSFSSTCQDLADFYTLYDTNDPEISTCEFVQIESRYCGCQSEPDLSPVNACKICADGSAPVRGDKFIPELQMTCNELENYMNYLPADQCDMPWTADFKRFDYFCGCTNSTAPCPICSDGSIEITNPEFIIPYLIIPNNENPTCQELATLGVIAEPNELVLDDCSLFEAQASFCGCPNTVKPVESCTFCPGGEAPPNSAVNTPFGDTCGELNEYLSFLPPEECDSQRVGFIKRQDFLCGCPSATTNCALCKDHGSNDVAFEDRHIPLLSLPLNPNPTCGEIVQFLAVNDGDLSDAGCTALQDYQGYCGCPSTTVKNECSFCPNGGTVADPSKVVSDVFTCQDLQDFVSYLSADQCAAGDSDFNQIQAFAYVCGCPNVQPSCSLCHNGESPPSPNTLIGDNDGTTCGEYYDYILTLTKDSCDLQQSRIQGFASACGCGSPVAPPTSRPALDDDGFAPTPTANTNTGSSSQSSSETKKKPQVNSKNVVIIVAVIVPVLLGLMVVVYYFFNRKSIDEKVLQVDESEGGAPLPVENMQGSLSISDIPISTSPKASSPRAEMVSIDENESSLVSDGDHKIV